MTKKRNPIAEPIISGGAAPARKRKHSTATRAVDVPAENPSSIESTTAAVSAAVTPTFEEIAALAYSYWEARGCQGGSPESDWLRAEQELRHGLTAAATA
jgi:Protein of unknown function (DUF2934)